jgi:uncharacterized protein (DUF2336 family)
LSFEDDAALRRVIAQRTTFESGPVSDRSHSIAARVVLDFGLAQRIIAVPDVDALALLCRSAAFERAVFVALCVSIDKTRPGVGMSEQFGEIYERVPVVAAQRAVRFWKVRARELGRAAAA